MPEDEPPATEASAEPRLLEEDEPPPEPEPPSGLMVVCAEASIGRQVRQRRRVKRGSRREEEMEKKVFGVRVKGKEGEEEVIGRLD